MCSTPEESSSALLQTTLVENEHPSALLSAQEGAPARFGRLPTVSKVVLFMLALAGITLVTLLGGIRMLSPDASQLGASGGELVKIPVDEPPLMEVAVQVNCASSYQNGWACTRQAKTYHKKGWMECCNWHIVQRMLFFDKPFDNDVPRFGRCALVGGSSILRNAHKGREIDGHDTVIRINRLPNPEFYNDFGKKADVIMMAVTNQATGRITLMRDGFLARCDALDNCKNTGLVFLQVNGNGCPLEILKEIWHADEHSFIACPQLQLFWMARALSSRTDTGFERVTKLLTTGFMATMTFAPLCSQLDLYGFGGTKTADGHVEWDGHDLGLEHRIQHQLAGERWWDLKVEGQHNTFWEYWKRHAGTITMK